MKKWIAMALCLVLALSLCTVAFAESGEGYTLVQVVGGVPVDSAKLDKNTTVTVTKTASSTTTVDGVSTTTVYADKYEFSGVISGIAYECDASIADYRLVKGSTVIHLATNMALSAGVSKVVTAKIDAVDALTDRKCGQPDIVDAVYVIDGKFYSVNGASLALRNGKVVYYDDMEVQPVAHELYKGDGATCAYNAKGEPVSVTCAACKASFAVVKADGIPTSYAKVPAGLDIAFAGAGYYVLENVAASSTAVDSPKTFDAGIALYAGMALMSVAGSAVVIGKKEF